jgi:hypothetical protein
MKLRFLIASQTSQLRIGMRNSRFMKVIGMLSINEIVWYPKAHLIRKNGRKWSKVVDEAKEALISNINSAEI